MIKYSRTFAIGKLAKPLSKEALSGEYWNEVRLSADDFNTMKSMYFPAHINAMLRHTGMESCHFLKDVCCMELKIQEKHVPMQLNGATYPSIIEGVKVYFYPCHMAFLVVEITDENASFDSLTKMHFYWKEWNRYYKEFRTDMLDSVLAPLVSALGVKDAGCLLRDDTKMNLFQIVQTNETTLSDETLYDLGSSSPIGTAQGGDRLSPAQAYYDQLMKENTVAAFRNWKALALNDSFTVLANNENFDDWPFVHLYLPLLYLRCLLVKCFCMDYNDKFHSGQTVDNERSLNEIDNMERYYFYDTLGYDFLPKLLYAAMVKGVGLQAEREELTQHVKEMLREQRRMEEERREKRNNHVLTIVNIFAVISLAGTLLEFIFGIFPCIDDCAKPWWTGGILIAAVATIVILLVKSRPNKVKDKD